MLKKSLIRDIVALFIRFLLISFAHIDSFYLNDHACYDYE